MSCTALVNAPIQEILFCAISQATGGIAIASILIFVLILYGMYKARIPMQALLPLGIFMLFVFAGAGIADGVGALGGFSGFSIMLIILIMFVGAAIVFAFWKLRRPF